MSTLQGQHPIPLEDHLNTPLEILIDSLSEALSPYWSVITELVLALTIAKDTG